MDFIPRQKLNKNINTNTNDYLSNIVEQSKNLNLNDIDFKNSQYDIIKTKIEKEKIYFWIRVYLHEEMGIKPDTNITIKYIHSGETLSTKFICYAKMGGGNINYENGEPIMTNYNSEDNKKLLCLMVDEETINYSENIPFIRKLFKIGRHYEYVLMKRTDLILSIDSTGEILNYYDIEF